MKKTNILLALGTFSTIAAPIAIVVSCGNNIPKSGNTKEQSVDNIGDIPTIQDVPFDKSSFLAKKDDNRKANILSAFTKIENDITDINNSPGHDDVALMTMINKDKLAITDVQDNMYLHLTQSYNQLGIKSHITSQVNGDTLDITISLSADNMDPSINKDIKLSIGGWAATTVQTDLDAAIKATVDKMQLLVGPEANDGSLLHHDSDPNSWTKWVNVHGKSKITPIYINKYDVDVVNVGSARGIAFNADNISRLDKSNPDYKTSVNAEISLNPLTKSLQDYISTQNITIGKINYQIKNLKDNDAFEKAATAKQKYNLGNGPMNINDIATDGVKWMNGIGWFAYQETTSYILNFAKKLGWTPIKDSHFQNKDANGASYLDNETLITNLDNFIKQVPTLDSAKNTDAVGESALYPAKTELKAHSTYLDPVSSDGTTGVIIPNTLGFDFKSTIGENHSSGRFGEGDNQVTFNLGATYHDGDNPGSLIMKLWAKKGSANAIYTGHTAAEYGKTYKALNDTEITNFYKFMVGSLISLKNNFSKWGSSLPSGNSTEDFRTALKYLVENDFSDKQIWDTVNYLNNGSHYLPAINVFMRGFHFDDSALSPAGSHPNLKGLIDLTSAYDMTSWMHNQDSYAKPASDESNEAI